MKSPIQINGDKSWGGTPHQEHRVYSVYGGGICIQTTKYMNILELYECASD